MRLPFQHTKIIPQWQNLLEKNLPVLRYEAIKYYYNFQYEPEGNLVRCYKSDQSSGFSILLKFFSLDSSLNDRGRLLHSFTPLKIKLFFVKHEEYLKLFLLRKE